MPHLITSECTGCGVCLIKCPTDAISGARKQLHVIDPGLCIDCRICGRWCPYEVIMDDDGRRVPRFKAKDIPKAQVVNHLCSGCNFCVDACPSDVISLVPFGDDRLSATVAMVATVNTTRCTGCQLCEEVCIKNAIFVDAGTADRPSTFQLHMLCGPK